ncbi:uncharacterized protein [Choristoneura fumiferana]|uniref:uncharacterized protein n=1 Tax=Choristoneura fumiferana TaxID=7141 RepID=UPI003D1591AF
MYIQASGCANVLQLRRTVQIYKKLRYNYRLLSRRQKIFSLGILTKCKKLKQLSLNLLNQGGDSSLKEIVATETLEELIILRQDKLTGSFLTNLRTNLKTLIFVNCYSLLIENILSVADRLTALTRLELNYNSINTLQNVHLLLDKTPNLERLSLEYYKNNLRSPWIKLGNELPTAIGRLSRLRELCLQNNDFVTDEWLTTVARGCPALRSVDLGRTWVHERGLLALCRERPELVELVVSTPFVKDEDLEACARHCAGLELLDVSYSHRLPKTLPARLAWPRARPLRLRMYDVLKEKTEVHYEGITLLWDKPRRCSWPD